MTSNDSLPAAFADTVDFLGRGISWPLQVDHTGSIRLTEGAENVEQSIRIILSTAPGERVFRPAFGCTIWDLLFEPINARTIGLMAQAVRDALGQWEPRITVEKVTVEPDPARQGAVRIQVAYAIAGSNDRRNLVHPFYVIPREGDE